MGNAFGTLEDISEYSTRRCVLCPPVYNSIKGLAVVSVRQNASRSMEYDRDAEYLRTIPAPFYEDWSQIVVRKKSKRLKKATGALEFDEHRMKLFSYCDVPQIADETYEYKPIAIYAHMPHRDMRFILLCSDNHDIPDAVSLEYLQKNEDVRGYVFYCPGIARNSKREEKCVLVNAGFLTNNALQQLAQKCLYGSNMYDEYDIVNTFLFVTCPCIENTN